jgi:outer membrane receptor protein involved in Fe transport
MKTLFALILTFMSLSIQAQTIKGLVFSEKDKAPIDFASVALITLPDSTTVTGTTTQSGGKFSIENVKAGSYCLKVTFMGYQTYIKAIEVENGAKTVQADTLFLSNGSVQLKEVVVTGQRLQSKELVDRTVYSIPTEIAKTSTNGYEVLKKIPAIQVDFNNNVTLNGSSNFIIQVDGKTRDKEFLAKLLPTDIETVEIISNPSGKYEGTVDGIINIILKKEARVGTSGNFSAGGRLNKNPSGSANGSLDYGLGKISFYATGYTFFQKLNVNSTSYSNFKSLDSVSDVSSKNGKIKLSSSSINTGFDYYVNDKNTLSFNVNFKPVSEKINVFSEGNIEKNNILSGSIQSHPNTSSVSKEENISLFYKKNYKKPIQELTSELKFYHFKSTDENTYKNNFYNTGDSLLKSSSYSENNINERSAYTAKVDYVQPLGISSRVETGYQYYYQFINYSYASQDNLFKYIEARNAAYAGITYNIGKFGFQTTWRLEYSTFNVQGRNSDTIRDPSNYPAVLPSANIMYKITPLQNIKFTYNRRIRRPGISDLYPYPKISSNYNVSTGNLYLKPEYRDKLQLTYTLNIGKNYISPNVYYEKISSKIGTVNSLEISPLTMDSTLYTSPQNVLTGYERGVGLNAMLWFFNINARFYQGHYNSFGSIAAQNYSSFAINSYVYGQLPWKINAFGFINYNGVSVNYQSKTYSTPFYGFGAQKAIGNHTFGFFYLLPLSKNITLSKTITETSTVYSKTSYGFDVSYYIQFQYTYKFNKGRAVKKIVRKDESESDSKNNGIGK